jgi:hypothetical protein
VIHDQPVILLAQSRLCCLQFFRERGVWTSRRSLGSAHRVEPKALRERE